MPQIAEECCKLARAVVRLEIELGFRLPNDGSGKRRVNRVHVRPIRTDLGRLVTSNVTREIMQSGHMLDPGISSLNASQDTSNELEMF